MGAAKITKSEWAVLIAIFLDLLGFGMVIPDIQTRAEHFLNPDGVSKLPVGLIIGLMLALTFIIQAVVSPRWGRLADKTNRKNVFMICGAFSALGMLVYGLANSIGIIFLSRILSGFGAANVAVAQAMITADSNTEERTAKLGRVSAAISAGLVGGPALGGFLGATSWGNHAVGWVGAAGSGLGLLIAFVAIPSKQATTVPQPAPQPERKLNPVIDLGLLKRFPAVVPLFGVAVVASFALATLEGTFGRLIKHMLGYGSREFGFIFSYESILGVIVSAFLLGMITKRASPSGLLKLAYALQGIGLALNPGAGVLCRFLPGFLTLIIASTLYAVGSGIANPALSAATSRLVPDNAQGELFGLLQVARNFGCVVGPMLGGFLFDWHMYAPYLFAGFVCLTVVVFLPKLNGEIPTARPEPIG